MPLPFPSGLNYSAQKRNTSLRFEEPPPAKKGDMTNQQTFDTVIAGGTVVTGTDVTALDIGVVAGRIAALMLPGTGYTAAHTIDASGRLVLPCGIDSHTHVE